MMLTTGRGTKPPRFWGVGGEGTLERAEGTTPKVLMMRRARHLLATAPQ
jgi:hypothetical protein